MLSAVWIEVESGRIRYITACSVRNDRDVVAYLALIRVAFKRIKRVAYRDIGRPCRAAVCAPGVK